MYRDIPMSQRLDRIGEILAKGVYLYLKEEKMTVKGAPRGKQTILPKGRMKEKAGKSNRMPVSGFVSGFVVQVLFEIFR